MFSPVAMQRLNVVVLERDSRAVLRGLGRLGVIHLLQSRAGPDTAPLAPPDRSQELARCESMLSRIDNLRSRLAVAPAAETAGDAPQTPDLAEGVLGPLEARANDLLARQQALRHRWNQVEILLAQASAYESLKIPLEQLGGATFLHFAIGRLPAGSLDELKAKVGPNVVLAAMPEVGDLAPLVAVTSRKGRFALETALKQAGFVHEQFCVEGGETAASLSEEGRRERDQLAADLKEADADAAAVARAAAKPLADIERFLIVERHILQAEQNFPRTEQTVLMTGWVPAADVTSIQRHLMEMTGERCIVQATDPKDIPEHDIPVLLRHSRILRPFVMLLENYGLPTYREIEPTVFMAVSWVIMFGMMFGDAGNGAVVAAGGLYLLLKGRTMGYRDAGLLLLFAGLSSVAFGMYYGSYFGITKIGGHPLGNDPLEGNPMALMIAAVAVGIVLMSLGLVLNIVNRFRRGDILGGFLDKFGIAGAVFYWGCLFLLLYYVVFKAGELGWWQLVLVIVLPLIGVALKEPLHYLVVARHLKHEGGHAEGGLMEACIESAIEAFDTVLGFLANTISFVRLAAYAMAHAAVLLASFAIGEQLEKGLGGPLGWFLMLVVVILGNVIAILLEGIVASVQAIRLEYYEFFGKFFSGAGQAFKPFRFPVKGQGLSPQG